VGRHKEELLLVIHLLNGEDAGEKGVSSPVTEDGAEKGLSRVLHAHEERKGKKKGGRCSPSFLRLWGRKSCGAAGKYGKG